MVYDSKSCIAYKTLYPLYLLDNKVKRRGHATTIYK